MVWPCKQISSKTSQNYSTKGPLTNFFKKNQTKPINLVLLFYSIQIFFNKNLVRLYIILSKPNHFELIFFKMPWLYIFFYPSQTV